jgi:glycosyltransferase involved in cell wall biosynthesis
VYNLLRRIAEKHEVSLAATLTTPEEADAVEHLKQFCDIVETGYVQRKHPLIHLPGLVLFALAGMPLELKFVYSKELANKIRKLFLKRDFDIVQLEHSRMAPYIETLPAGSKSKSILAFHNVAYDQFARISRLGGKVNDRMRAWLHSRMMRRWEPSYAERFDRCIAMSDEDRYLLTTVNPRLKVDVIPNGVDTQMYQPLELPVNERNLLFIGTLDYPPGSDAALYFCNQILPHINGAIGNVQVWIVGANPPPEVNKLSEKGVHVTGRVKEVLPYYKQSTACIVPLRAGGGTRLKILEAMALGRPVISTSIGCEGLGVVDGKHLLIADTPEQFAEKTVHLLTDKLLYNRIVAEARQLVVARYDWDAIAEKLMALYIELTARSCSQNVGC